MPASMRRVHVVAGIIFSKCRKKILIAKRPDHLHKGGFWEFPGGKLEPGEDEVQGLRRELKEELNVEFARAVPFHSLEFDYPEKRIFLSFWSVFDVINEENIEGLEGQLWLWADIDRLSEYQFPEANAVIVEQLLQKHGAE